MIEPFRRVEHRLTEGPISTFHQLLVPSLIEHSSHFHPCVS